MKQNCKECSYRSSCSNQIENSGFIEKQTIINITGECHSLSESDKREVLERPSYLSVLLTGIDRCLYERSMFTPLVEETPPWSL